VPWHTDRHGWKASGDDIRNVFFLEKNDGQRPRPDSRNQFFGRGWNFFDQLFKILRMGHMDD
jgi:hypothetical protein